ncbi:MAG: hypothetical protein HRT47_13280 [Candidatus Caenarcaniphilales bacterium]|nr:hypothetical protein [Candidatus Caenarcaniphilales bacterium]
MNISEGTLLFEIWKFCVVVLMGLAVLAFGLTPFNMHYRDKKSKGQLDPNKSFLENFFSIP